MVGALERARAAEARASIEGRTTNGHEWTTNIFFHREEGEERRGECVDTLQWASKGGRRGQCVVGALERAFEEGVFLRHCITC